MLLTGPALQGEICKSSCFPWKTLRVSHSSSARVSVVSRTVSLGKSAVMDGLLNKVVARTGPTDSALTTRFGAKAAAASKTRIIGRRLGRGDRGRRPSPHQGRLLR